MIYISASQEEFIDSLTEMRDFQEFTSSDEYLSDDIRYRVITDEAKAKNIEYDVVDDNLLFKVFDSIEKYKELCAFYFATRKESYINKLATKIGLMSYVTLVNNNVKLYPNFDPDDTYKIARIIAGE